jgi:hypothetical protein
MADHRHVTQTTPPSSMTAAIREILWLVWGTRDRMPTDMKDGVATVGGVKASAIYFLSPSIIGLRGFAVWGLIVRLYRTNLLLDVLTILD